jgi:site-specific DNA-methyltransferase (adenine-specific)
MKVAPEVTSMDCNDFLKTFDDDSIDLLFTDPPYSTDVPNIAEFTESWLSLAIQKTKKTGRMLIFSGSYPKEIQAFLNVLMAQDKFIVDNPLIWTYKNTLGITPKMKYNLNYQIIWHLYSDDSPELDISITNEMFSVTEMNAPDGRLGDRFHTWQKPFDLAIKLVRHTTKEGDLVVDPFTCTGTFLIAANTLGRVGKGCDNDQKNLDIAVSRGCQLIDNKSV